MVAAAVIGAAVVGAAGSAVAGSEAASATNNASNASVAEQNSALQQQATLSAPYRAVGQGAISQYENLLGTGPNSNSQTISQALAQTPGYQFTQQQGEQGILNAASAAGGFSGNTVTALDRYNTGLAQNTYQTALGNSLNAVQLGQAAAAGQAANIGNAASNISSTLTNQGNNIANVDIGEAAGISKAVGNAGNQYVEYSALQSLNNGGGAGVDNTAPTSVAGMNQGGYTLN
jgi:hypothetical protein